MAQETTTEYDKIYGIARNGFNGDSTIWNTIYEYICLHPAELFAVVGPRKWAIGHQLVFHGAVDTFKKILLLYNQNNPINIFSSTKDTPQPKTILDIATERKRYYQEQFDYITDLCNQDRFIQACQAYNWSVIDEMLQKFPKLLNKKPPYCSNYFIHYLVLNKDVRKFAQYNLAQNRLQLDLKNADNKTALELARQINAQNIITEIKSLIPQHYTVEPSQKTKSTITPKDEQPERHESDEERSWNDDDNNDEQLQSPPTTTTSRSQATTSISTTSAAILPLRTPPTTSSAATTGTSVVSGRTTPTTPSITTTGIPIGSGRASNMRPFTPTASVISSTGTAHTRIASDLRQLSTIPIQEIIMRVKCPLTGNVFVDPVIASDGLTYERSAIAQHIRDSRYSPATGEVLEDTFEPNECIKHLIETLRAERVIK